MREKTMLKKQEYGNIKNKKLKKKRSKLKKKKNKKSKRMTIF